MDEYIQMKILFILSMIPLISYGFMVTFFIISILYGRLTLYRMSKLPPDEEVPGVSIVKPLMGIDPLLQVNLESHFTLNYPKYELLLCVESEEDEALSVVSTLRARYPLVDCRIFTGGLPNIINPMVFNMAPAYINAKYDIVWISTSRIKATTEILLDMVAKLANEKVALVHQIPFTTDQQGFAHNIDKVYFGTTVARYNLAFNGMGVSCFTGMSYLVKKKELDAINGGLPWFGRFLAEDFFLAKMLHEKGFRHQIAAVPAQQNVASLTVAAYKDRMVRWLRLRLNMMPLVAGVLEPLAASIPLGVYASWSAYHLFGFDPYIWFAAHIFIWSQLDYLILRKVQNKRLPFNYPMYLLTWFVCECLYVYIYVEAVLNPRRIFWGKRQYKLSNFGQSLQLVTDRSLINI